MKFGRRRCANCRTKRCAPGDPRSPPHGLAIPLTKPFSRLEAGTWLHDRPARDVYVLLVDVYKLRIADRFTYERKFEPVTPRRFARFLDRVGAAAGATSCPRGGTPTTACCASPARYGCDWFIAEMRMFLAEVCGPLPSWRHIFSWRRHLARRELGLACDCYSAFGGRQLEGRGDGAPLAGRSICVEDLPDAKKSLDDIRKPSLDKQDLGEDIDQTPTTTTLRTVWRHLAKRYTENVGDKTKEYLRDPIASPKLSSDPITLFDPVRVSLDGEYAGLVLGAVLGTGCMLRVSGYGEHALA
ncbi:unnamed protein product [Parascedosporium putredinis]|uniref:Uncharacterized protein n=1 Tax=Parascedosporium putredinis TaxID=1442378 RepID=A0A9P1GW23_9PEZI|nr:unnamed protein product [Parascedosporium putredinis]CAI7988064.1 unnamed protein product [Parascedosporium putredinis]